MLHKLHTTWTNYYLLSDVCGFQLCTGWQGMTGAMVLAERWHFSTWTLAAGKNLPSHKAEITTASLMYLCISCGNHVHTRAVEKHPFLPRLFRCSLWKSLQPTRLTLRSSGRFRRCNFRVPRISRSHCRCVFVCVCGSLICFLNLLAHPGAVTTEHTGTFTDCLTTSVSAEVALCDACRSCSTGEKV